MFLAIIFLITSTLAQDRKLKTTLQNNNEQKPERKAYFTPYYNLHDNDEALTPGEKIPEPKVDNNGGGGLGMTPGNMSAPMPSPYPGM